MQHGFTRRAIGTLLAITCLLLLMSLWNRQTFTHPYGTQTNNAAALENGRNHRVAKVSMLYGTPTNPLYERALRSHERHAQRWGYPMKVLQRDVLGGYWNKPSYLLSIILQELVKPPSEQVEWLMWVDADSIIINPAIPAEIFLPPADMPEIHMVSAKDQNGLNTGIVFFHVHTWTVAFLIAAMGYPLWQPDVDLGFSADQEAMARLLKQCTGGPEGRGFCEGNVYYPRAWINTYEWHHAYEGKKGDLLVHFPGLQDARWSHMSDWLDIVEKTPREWEVPVDQTDYPDKLAGFWDRFRAARNAANSVQEDIFLASKGAPTAAREAAVAQLRNALQEHADEPDVLQERLGELRSAVSRETS